MNVKIYVQEKVGKEKDILVKTWIGTAQVFVTAEKNLPTKLEKIAQTEWEDLICNSVNYIGILNACFRYLPAVLYRFS